MPVDEVGLSVKTRYFFLVFFMFMLLISVPNVHQTYGDKTEAELRISQAEDSLKAAYLLILETEKAGGQILDYVAIMNSAMDNYCEAERALKSGDYELASLLAVKAIKFSNEVLDTDVKFFVFVAERIRGIRLRNQILLSAGIICFTIFSGFFGWRLFKRYYIRRMNKNPTLEMVIDES